MDFNTAKNFRMPWGKYLGVKLDDIARTDEGLRYLDWVRGQMEKQHPLGDVAKAVGAYLDDPAITSELEKVVRS